MPSSRGIFPAQGLNLHLLHWQAGSLPLSPQGSPIGNSHFAMYLKPAQHCQSTILQKIFFNWKKKCLKAKFILKIKKN